MVEEGVSDWLEIDLGELKVITAVETQGRFGNGEVTDALKVPAGNSDLREPL